MWTSTGLLPEQGDGTLMRLKKTVHMSRQGFQRHHNKRDLVRVRVIVRLTTRTHMKKKINGQVYTDFFYHRKRIWLPPSLLQTQAYRHGCGPTWNLAVCSDVCRQARDTRVPRTPQDSRWWRSRRGTARNPEDYVWLGCWTEDTPSVRHPVHAQPLPLATCTDHSPPVYDQTWKNTPDHEWTNYFYSIPHQSVIVKLTASQI